MDPKTNWNEPSIQTTDVLFDFLNTCGRCHVKRDSRRLLERLKLARPFLQELKGLAWTRDLESVREIGGERLALRRIVQISFDLLAHDGPERFGYVAASKLIHVYNANLLIPWDNPIRKELKLKPDAFSYAFKFLPKMVESGEEAIRAYMAEHPSHNTQSAIHAIESDASEHGETRVTFAKLIDEYNWLNARQSKENDGRVKCCSQQSLRRC